MKLFIQIEFLKKFLFLTKMFSLLQVNSTDPTFSTTRVSMPSTGNAFNVSVYDTDRPLMTSGGSGKKELDL